MGRKYRIALLILVDAINVSIAYFMALLIRFDGEIPLKYLENFKSVFLFFAFIGVMVLFVVGLYNRIWRYASIGELMAIIVAVFVMTLLQLGLTYLFVESNEAFLPRSVFIIAFALQTALIGGSRLAWRTLLNYKHGNDKNGKKILIVGAGDAGIMVAKEIKNHFQGNANIVGFIDDNQEKRGAKILGIPVLGNRGNIKEICSELEVAKIIIAIPSAKMKDIREVIGICRETDAEVKILPRMYDLITGKVNVSKIREVRIEDLLGRDPVSLDMERVPSLVDDKIILITGAGGSIGSEIVRQLCLYKPKLLLLLDINENAIFDITNEIRVKHPQINYIDLIKNVREGYSVREVFEKYRPDLVFHAAAHKHVPLMERNGEEAVKNNIRGTYNILKYADQYKVAKVVAISTDKAVNPTNIMGASKRVCELLVQYFNQVSETDYMAVRFGNVLGSQGSVIPLFRKQIEVGGPVTVTDPEIIRYFMTIPEAVQLVIQSATLSRGGEIMVLDMGDPVKILDLAETLIRLSGYTPYKDIEIVFTGLRPGEKLYEELICSEERCDKTTHERIFTEKLILEDRTKVEKLIGMIESNNLPLERKKIVELLLTLVPEYTPYDYEEEDKALRILLKRVLA